MSLSTLSLTGQDAAAAPKPGLFDEELGQQMIAEGYSVTHHFATCFHVHRPAQRGGGHYKVDVADDSCNCCARTRCRHRRALGTLVFLWSDRLGECGHGQEAAQLLRDWSDACDEAKTGRQAEEFAAEERRAA